MLAEVSQIITVCEADVSLGGSRVTQTRTGHPGSMPGTPASLTAPRSRGPQKQGVGAPMQVTLCPPKVSED